MKAFLSFLTLMALWTSTASASPRAAFAAAQAAYRSGDYTKTQSALRLTWQRLPPGHRRGASGVRVLVLLGKSHAKQGAHMEAAVCLGRALHALEAQSPTDRATLGSVRRLLQEVDLTAPFALGEALVERAEAARSPAARVVHALAAETLLRDHAEFGEASDLRLLARSLAMFPASDPRHQEASRLLLEATKTAETATGD